MLAPPASAKDIYWQGGTASYTTATNWVDGVVPGSGDNAMNDNGSNNVVQINGGDPDWTVWDIRAGNVAGTSGALVQSGPTVSIGGWFRLGVGGGAIGYYTLDSGILNVKNSRLNIGESGTGFLRVNDGTINFNSGSQYALGDGAAGSSGTVIQNGGTINCAGELWVGNGAGVGAYHLNGGTLNIHNWVAIGRFGGSGTVVMTGGTLTKDGNGNFLVVTGNGSSGELDHGGGAIICQNQFLVPEGGACTGTYNMSNTASLTVNNWLAIGRGGGTGILNLSGGTITKGGSGNIVIGAGGAGTVNQTGGSIVNPSSPTWLGEGSSATWTMTGGTNLLGAVVLALNSSSSGVLSLNGGLFQATGITCSSGAYSQLDLDGVTLKANGNNASFVAGLTTALVGSAGVTIDSQAYNIGIPQGLQDNGGGGLTKDGTGTLTLSGANSFSGATKVNAGIVKVGTSSTGGGACTVADNAGFGPITQSANGQLNVSALTLGSSTGAALYFDLGAFGNPAAAPLNVANLLTVSGTVTVNVAASVIAEGTIPLLRYGDLAGTLTTALGTLPPGVVAQLASSNNTIYLVVTSAGAPRWDGQILGEWSFGTNQDWFDLGTLQPTPYTDGKPVVFNDDAAGTTTVKLTATVRPASIDFNNETKPYSLIGSGAIAGSIGLNVNGAGGASLLNTGGNSFTGPVVINAGVLAVTNLADGGSPSALGASSSDPTNLVINSGTFTYGGAAAVVKRGFTVGSTNSTFAAEGDLTLSGRVAAAANTLGGGSAFIKTGAAQLALAGTGTNEFANIRNPGVQVANGTLLLDGSAGGQVNHTVNELWVGSTNGTGGALILSNTVLYVDSWLGLGRGNSLNTTSSVTLFNSAFSMGNCSLGYWAGVTNYQAAQVLTLNGNSTLTNYGEANLGENSGANSTVRIYDNAVFFSGSRVALSMETNSATQMVIADSGKAVVTSYVSVANGDGTMASLLLKDNASFLSTSDFNVTDNGASTANVTVQDNARLAANNLFVGKDNNADGVLTITNNASVISSNGLTMATHWSGAAVVPTRAVVNLAGGSLAVNLVQGNNNCGIFNFNGGRLVARNPFATYFMFNLAEINVLGGGAVIDSDTYSISIAQPLLDGGGNGGLTKVGGGALYLDGANTYTGSTLVSDGTLGGIGSIAGPVTVASGARLATASSATGTLTLAQTLALSAGSTTFLKLSPSGNDQVVGLTGVTYGGALVVTNIDSAPLTVGAVYKLFDCSVAGIGNFSSVTVLPAGSGTFNPATGELTITSVSDLLFSTVIASGGNLILQGTGGIAGGDYTLLTTTNIATPLASWTTNSTGVLDGAGAFSNAIPVNVAEPGRFFRVRVP